MRTQFDDAIGVVPPSPIDVDELINRGRRRGAYRRIGFIGTAVGGVAVALAVAAGVLPATGLAPGGGGAGAGAAATGRKDQAATAARLTAALVKAVNAQAPGVRRTNDKLMGKLLQVQHLPQTGYAGPFPITSGGPDNVDYYAADAVLAYGGKAGELSVFIGRTEAVTGPDMSCHGPIGNVISCQTGSGPRGEQVIQREMRVEDRGASRRTFLVDVTKSDGTTVRIMATNDLGRPGDGRVAGPTPVLSFAQLIAIGADQGLTVSP
jgi:hypothetical protein